MNSLPASRHRLSSGRDVDAMMERAYCPDTSETGVLRNFFVEKSTPPESNRVQFGANARA